MLQNVECTSQFAIEMRFSKRPWYCENRFRFPFERQSTLVNTMMDDFIWSLKFLKDQSDQVCSWRPLSNYSFIQSIKSMDVTNSTLNLARWQQAFSLSHRMSLTRAMKCFERAILFVIHLEYDWISPKSYCTELW